MAVVGQSGPSDDNGDPTDGEGASRYLCRVRHRISTEAYDALREALAVITWFKPAFQSFVHAALREHPELLAPLNFSDTKRHVADALVATLVAKETRYQDVSLRLMMEIANKDRFPDIERRPEPDRSELLAQARAAVAELKRLVVGHEEALADQRRLDEELRRHEEGSRVARSHSRELGALKERFISLQGQDDRRQARGYEFERLLSDLLALYDLEPRLSYVTDSEQIDGSFRLDTDDYIVEAKWKAQPVGRDQADIFAAKVRSKGKNAMGLFVSVAGFADTFLGRFAQSTPFVTMDGHDLFLVLDDRIRLDDALRAKRRHANDTGSCHFPVSNIL